MYAIGDLSLPRELMIAIESGRWSPPADDRIYLEVFGDEPELPHFYDLAAIVRENRSWQSLSVESVYGELVAGESVGIEPRQSVVIGDLGPDMPIVLDYRLSSKRPRVAYLGFLRIPTWRVVAADFPDLVARLKL